MAQSPRFKVYDPEGKYIGCTKGADEAVVLARYKGVGASVRDGHSFIVYDVGREPFTNEHAAAADIYVAMNERNKARAKEFYAEQQMAERAASMRKKLKMYDRVKPLP
tara:strand:+ start:97 stop:420 length:324 start_codon:yes stop_codon:yes gene_type:complete